MLDSEETIWDPNSSLSRAMPPSDFVLDSSRSSLSQTKKNWLERLLPRPSTPQTPTHVKFISLWTWFVHILHIGRKSIQAFNKKIYKHYAFQWSVILQDVVDVCFISAFGIRDCAVNSIFPSCFSFAKFLLVFHFQSSFFIIIRHLVHLNLLFQFFI